MPKIDVEQYGIKPRLDGQLGYVVVTPTTSRYTEFDGTDIRVNRIKVYGPNGRLDYSLLIDELGVPFVDNLPGAEDDMGYLKKLQKSR